MKCEILISGIYAEVWFVYCFFSFQVDFADGFKLEYTDDLDPEIMALMANNKANSTANAVSKIYIFSVIFQFYVTLQKL